MESLEILLPGNFRTMPWKNGGGTTHEIARADRNGKMLWRLSIAEVEADGPFSTFAGMTRLLAVIAGQGMRLEAEKDSIAALPLTPVRFSGDEAIFGRLRDGPVRDLNFIFDKARIAGDMIALAGPNEARIEASPVAALVSLAGDITVNGLVLPAGAASLGARQDARLGSGAIAIAITGRAIIA